MPDYDYLLYIDGVLLGTDEKAAIGMLSFEESMESGQASVVQFTVKDVDGCESVLERIRLEVEVRLLIGNNARWHDVFLGAIVDIEIGLSADNLDEVSVFCHDLGYKLKKYGLPKAVITGSTFHEVVERIASGFGLSGVKPYPKQALDIDMSDQQGIVFGGFTVEEATQRTRRGLLRQTVHKHGDTPWVALDKIAEKLGLKLLVRGRWLFMVREDFLWPEQPWSFSLVYGEAPNFQREAIMLSRFNATTPLAGKSSDVRAVTWSPVADVIPESESPRMESTTRLDPGFITERQMPWDIPPTLGAPPDRPRRQGGFGGITGTDRALTFEAGPKTEVELAHRFVEFFGLVTSVKGSVSAFLERNAGDIALTHQPYGFGAALARIATRELLGTDHDARSQTEAAQSPVNMPVEMTDHGLTTQEQVDIAAIAKQREIYERMTEGRATCEGDPRLRAGHKHQVALGVLGQFGLDYSGEYFIESVKHEFDEDRGYITSMTLTRPYIRSKLVTGTLRMR